MSKIQLTKAITKPDGKTLSEIEMDFSKITTREYRRIGDLTVASTSGTSGEITMKVSDSAAVGYMMLATGLIEPEIDLLSITDFRTLRDEVRDFLDGPE